MTGPSRKRKAADQEVELDGEKQATLQNFFDLITNVNDKSAQSAAEKLKQSDPMYKLVMSCSGITLDEVGKLLISDPSTLVDVNRVLLIFIGSEPLQDLLDKCEDAYKLKKVFKRKPGGFGGTMVEWVKEQINAYNTTESENFFGVIVKPALTLCRALAAELESMGWLGAGLDAMTAEELRLLMMWFESDGLRQKFIDLFVKMAGYFSQTHFSKMTRPNVIRAMNKENPYVDGGLTGRPAELAKKSQELSLKRIAKKTAVPMDELTEDDAELEDDASNDASSSDDEPLNKKQRRELEEGRKAIATLEKMRAKNKAKNERKKANKAARRAAAAPGSADGSADNNAGKKDKKKGGGKKRY